MLFKSLIFNFSRFLVDYLPLINTQDVATEIVAYTQQGPGEVVILSASGAISSVLLRQSNSPSGVVKYEVYHFMSLCSTCRNIYLIKVL